MFASQKSLQMVLEENIGGHIPSPFPLDVTLQQLKFRVLQTDKSHLKCWCLAKVKVSWIFESEFLVKREISRTNLSQGVFGYNHDRSYITDDPGSRAVNVDDWTACFSAVLERPMASVETE
jgi:hypothetical protein